MPVASPDLSPPVRAGAWKWWVCGLLLLATMINYMDRLTLNQTAKLIKEDPAFRLNNEQYGQIEAAFAVAFALGSILVGCMADRWNVWWMYPAAVLAWSLAGFATGLAFDFFTLLACRFALGLSEGSNWPCALRTTQRILPPAQRALGNGILQSGAAVGAVITPLIVLGLVPWTGTWRYPFMLVGGLGMFWAVLWLLVVRREDLALPAGNAPTASPTGGDSFLAIFRDVRLYVLAVVVTCINTTWHFFRAWMPLFLQEVHHYSLEETNWFTMAYYLATDAGSLTAGFVALGLARRGLSVHGSRLLVFFACALLTTLALAVGSLATGPLLLGVLLVVGFGALGLFPNYYSFSQELTFRHQGKVTGMLGCINWLAMAALQWLVGRSVDQTGSYAVGLGLAGLTPLVALVTLVLFWKQPAVAGERQPLEVRVGAPGAGVVAEEAVAKL